MSLRLALIGGEEFAEGFEEAHASLLKDTAARNRASSVCRHAPTTMEVRGRGGVTLIRGDLKPVRYQAGEIVR